TSMETSGVEVLDRKTVGIFETATLASPDGSELMRWLGANGFAVPTNLVSTIDTYAKEGWVFVAAKLRREQGELSRTQPHPLSFKFKTEKAVYPLRLTG